MKALLLALVLIELTGPNNQPIDINPMAIISVRPPRDGDHVGRGIRCLLHTADGKFIAVVEDCDHVKAKLQEEAPP